MNSLISTEIDVW